VCLDDAALNYLSKPAAAMSAGPDCARGGGMDSSAYSTRRRARISAGRAARLAD